MNKVKEIFSNNKESDSVGSTGRGSNSAVGDSTRTSNVGRDSSLRGTGNTVGRDESFVDGGRNDRGVATREAEAAATDGSSHTLSSKPTLPGHRHNLEENADFEKATGEKTHDHKHLTPITKEHHQHHETEEVIREREHDRHIHHVQHHVQPVLDTQHHDREHRTHVHPQTEIREQHVNTDEDKRLFAGLNQHKNEETFAPKDRTVIDKGEVVNENRHHHVHHVVQPVVERDTHHHSTIHTTIPVKHVTHEAPIVHQSSTHEPMALKDFVSQGGDLNSKLTYDQAGVLADGECARDVNGPAEKLVQELHLGGGRSGGASNTGAGTGSNTESGIGSRNAATEGNYGSNTGSGIGSRNTATEGNYGNDGTASTGASRV